MIKGDIKAICAQSGEHIVFAITRINLFSIIFHTPIKVINSQNFSIKLL